MRVLAVAGDIGATIAAVRLVTPLQAWAESGSHELRLRSLHETAAADLEWADVMVLQRATTQRAWQLLQRMQASGGAVLHEIDDLLTQMPAQLLQQQAVAQGLPWLRRSLGQADLVTVSTARLGAALQAEVASWCEVPNYALPQPAPPVHELQAPPVLCLASSDRVPVAALAEALRGQGWRVLAVGPVGEDLARAGVVVERRAPMPRAEFLALLRGQSHPVGLIPLGDTPFDACKSAVKWFDFALAGLPTIAARRPPYCDVIEHGRTGWLVDDTPAAWRTALARLRDEPGLFGGIATQARVEVEQRHALAITVQAWDAALAQVQPRPRRPALHGPARWLEAALIGLRRVNRARLARRA